MKKTVAIILAGLGILLAGAAEILAAPFVVESGFYQTSQFNQLAVFSGDNFAVSVTAGGGTLFGQVFAPGTGIVPAGFGIFPGFQGFLAPGPGNIQINGIDCLTNNNAASPCGGVLTFTITPITLPPELVGLPFTGEAPFTMTGQLVSFNEKIDIVGSGIMHVSQCPNNNCEATFARYDFAVAEPSTVVLVLSGLVAVGWSRWRGGKRAGSSRSTAAAD
jgi:hypothetical protein